MLDDLQKLIAFQPTSDKQTNVAALLDYVEQRIVRRGLTVHRLTHNGYHSLYISTTGRNHAAIMLQGHVDVVPGSTPFHVDGDTITGRGCYDMLFATASFLQIVDSLDTPSHYSISLLLTGDEELGGADGVAAMLEERNYTCDVCVLPDAGDFFGAMSVAAKGIYQLTLRVQGTSHHASRPWEGDGAGTKLVQFLSEVLALFDTSDQNNSTCTVSQLNAGTSAINQGPSEAQVGIDIRYTDATDFKRISTALSHLYGKYDVTVESSSHGEDFVLDTQAPLVQQFIALYEHEVGAPIELTKSHGSSDARFFSKRGVPVIMFRPNGGNAHGDEEWLSLSSWQKFHQLLTEYVTTTARQK